MGGVSLVDTYNGLVSLRWMEKRYRHTFCCRMRIWRVKKETTMVWSLFPVQNGVHFLVFFPADHIDEVGHRFDLSTQPFDAAEFYLSEARRLSGLGL